MKHLAHIREFPLLESGKLFVAPTRTKDVVSLEGSVFGGPYSLAADRKLVARIAASLLDAGTRRTSKAALRESLANRGASLSFSSDGDRTFFSAGCFPEDVPFVLSVIAECLSESTFPAKELEIAKKIRIGNLAEAKGQTGIQANMALSRMVFDSSHVNWEPTLDQKIAFVSRVTRADVSGFGKMLGKGGLTLAVVGDIAPEAVQASAERAFKKLPHGTEAGAAPAPNRKPATQAQTRLFMPDKANIDVQFGMSVALHKLDAAFVPLSVVTDMLGGGFAAHLMQTVREREGLTYGIYASLAGFDAGADGMFRIAATFAPEMYERGVEMTMHEVRAFLDSGITEETLEKKKEELIGSYLVGLSTTRGLASAIHETIIDGRTLAFVQGYPAIIHAVQLAEVRAAAELLMPADFALAAAGTFTHS